MDLLQQARAEIDMVDAEMAALFGEFWRILAYPCRALRNAASSSA